MNNWWPRDKKKRERSNQKNKKGMLGEEEEGRERGGGGGAYKKGGKGDKKGRALREELITEFECVTPAHTPRHIYPYVRAFLYLLSPPVEISGHVSSVFSFLSLPSHGSIPSLSCSGGELQIHDRHEDC